MPTTPPPSQPFPSVYWEQMRCRATFVAAGTHETADPEARHAIACVRFEDGFVLANIAGRGWCTPSGRLEPGETPMEAAVRETFEEAGCRLLGARLIGHYLIQYDDGSSARLPTFAGSTDGPGQIPNGSESLGARLVHPDDLPRLYYRWDSLLQAVFALAYEVTSPEEASSQP